MTAPEKGVAGLVKDVVSLLSQDKHMFGTVVNGTNIFAACLSQKSAFWGFVKIFGWEWKVLLMNTRCVSKFFISSVFSSDSQCLKIPHFGRLRT